MECSFAGGGMTVALSDTQLLCDMLRPLHSFSNASMTADTTSAFYTMRKPLSATINTLANALYRVRTLALARFQANEQMVTQAIRANPPFRVCGLGCM